LENWKIGKLENWKIVDFGRSCMLMDRVHLSSSVLNLESYVFCL
jgi:hypothetical protein